MALAAVVALTGLWHPSVQGSVKVNNLQVYVAGAAVSYTHLRAHETS